MNVIDRVESAKHTLTGSQLSKAISKATSHEVIGPKKKHVDYIQNALESGNVSLPDTADMLFERCNNSSWVVVFKALVTFHHLMSNANERFIQYVASKTTTWTLHNFIDKGGVQGYDMSHIIRRYSTYLSEKAYSYRNMGFDFCRVTRGKDKGVLRNMDSLKLLKALPAMQSLLDSLIATDISSNDLTNGVATAAFMLLFKDLIRLFACYNDGIINLLEKYFEMKKADCKTALEIYRKFVARMERVSEFLRTAEDAGIDKGDIPDLTKAPNSLLQALESHYQSLEKGKAAAPPANPITLPSFDVSHSTSFVAQPAGVSQTQQSSAQPTEASTDFLQEQKRMLEMFEKKKKEESEKQARIEAQSKQIPNPITPPQPTLKATAQQQSQKSLLVTEDLYAQPNKLKSNKPSEDLLLLDSAPVSNTPSLFAGSSSVSPPNMFSQNFSQTTYNQQYAANGFNQNVNFNSAFQNNQSKSTPNLMDDLLAPERVDGSMPNITANNNQNAQVNGDLNKGLERVAMSLDGLNVNPNLQKALNPNKGHNWGPPPSNVKTGGANFQMQTVARTTLPPAGYGAPPNMGMGPMNPMYQNQYRPPMQPFGVQQPNMYGANYPMMQQQMGGMYGGGGMNPAMGGFTQQSMTSTNSSNFMNDPFK